MFGRVLVLAVEAARTGWLARLARVLPHGTVGALGSPGGVREHARGAGHAGCVVCAYIEFALYAGLTGLVLVVYTLMLLTFRTFLRMCVIVYECDAEGSKMKEMKRSMRKHGEIGGTSVRGGMHMEDVFVA